MRLLAVLLALVVTGCGGGSPAPTARAPAPATAPAAPVTSEKPGPKDRCPVCGMFVAPYPSWVARLTWPDGSRRFFDGPKDLFLALADPAHHLPGLPPIGVEAAMVTEYYDLKLIPATEAYFVVGSDVVGPMGNELVPLADPKAAEDFRGDHGGKKTLRAHEVDASVLGELSH